MKNIDSRAEEICARTTESLKAQCGTDISYLLMVVGKTRTARSGQFLTRIDMLEALASLVEVIGVHATQKGDAELIVAVQSMSTTIGAIARGSYLRDYLLELASKKPALGTISVVYRWPNSMLSAMDENGKELMRGPDDDIMGRAIKDAGYTGPILDREWPGG